ncbi:RNA-binding S4 domain-containing protein [Streptomyces sp. NBC_00063]|uniref:RNA-binding S4 domain-containing protein n=1 Tax=Streptomyces sp. NBC_00063 TaxID=2975638 RepID=UPI003D7583FC
MASDTASDTASDSGSGAAPDSGSGTGSDSASSAAAAARAAGPGAGESVRIDSWIWSVRLAKTRSAGATACRGGHVRVNGERVKAAYNVRVGDEVRVRQAGGHERVVIVKRLIRKRVGAPVAVECYVDNSPPPPPRAPVAIRDRGAGRPTKRDRRDMDRLRATFGAGPVPPAQDHADGREKG